MWDLADLQSLVELNDVGEVGLLKFYVLLRDRKSFELFRVKVEVDIGEVSAVCVELMLPKEGRAGLALPGLGWPKVPHFFQEILAEDRHVERSEFVGGSLLEPVPVDGETLAE